MLADRARHLAVDLRQRRYVLCQPAFFRRFFDLLDEELISLFTAPAAAAVVVMRRYAEARDLAAQLEQALGSRAVIDQALGIIMAESRCSAKQAFAVLSRASNNRNVKLRDLATEIVTRVGGGLSPDSARLSGGPSPDSAR